MEPIRIDTIKVRPGHTVRLEYGPTLHIDVTEVLAAIEAQQPRRMVRPDGRIVSVPGDRVTERLAAGCTLATT